MKTYSKVQLIAMAVQVLVNNPDENTVFAREDGNIFLSENYAQLEAGNMKIYPLGRSECITDKKPNTAQKPAATKPAAKPANTSQAKPANKAVTAKAVDKTTNKEGKNPETRNQETKE